MFTGIITGRGTVLALEDRDGDAAGAPGRGRRGTVLLRLDAGELAEGLTLGASIAVDGVCLTVVETAQDPGASGRIALDLMGETLDRSTLGELRAGDLVNLERCIPAGARLDGHIVQGHVDGVGRVLQCEDLEDWRRLRISLPQLLAKYVAEKGSIAVDGVSLTVTEVSAVGDAAPWFETALIPATLDATGFGAKGPGQNVNLEVDVLAKYTERLLGFSQWEKGHLQERTAAAGEQR